MVFAEGERFREADVAHQRIHVLPFVHACNGGVVDERHGGMQFVEVGADIRSPSDRFAVTGDKQLGAEVAHRVQRAEKALHGARLVAAQGAEVGHGHEYRAEQVAGKNGALLWQPHRERIR